MPYAQTSLRAEKRALREKMRDMGLSRHVIAGELARRYRLRPRAAWREAYGWSLNEAAGHINAHTGQAGLDPGGISSMTGPHLSEYESWPGPASAHGPAKPSGRRPTPYLLALLASVYDCAVTDLIDLADREHLPPADLLILDKYRQNAQPAPTPVPPAQTRRADQTRDPGVSLALRNGDEPTAGRCQAGPTAARSPRPISALSALPTVAYLGIKETQTGTSGIEREIVMAAHESSGHAEHAERRDIGEATLEQIRADIVRLSREYMTALAVPGVPGDAPGPPSDLRGPGSPAVAPRPDRAVLRLGLPELPDGDSSDRPGLPAGRRRICPGGLGVCDRH